MRRCPEALLAVFRTTTNDLQTSGGSFALTDLGLSTFGLNQEDRDKLYSSVKGAYAEGKIVNVGEGNILGSFKFIQDEYKKALASGDLAKQEYYKGLTGLKGQKATEFLSGDLNKSIDNMVDKLIKDPKIQELYGKNLSKAGLRVKITEAVNKGGDLEAKQAQSLANQQIKTMLQVNKLASSGIIKSQEQYNEALKESTLAQYDSYDAMIKEDIARQKIIRQLLTAVNYWLNPIIGDLSTITVDNAETVIFKIVKDFLSKLWDAIQAGFTIGLSKLLKLILPSWAIKIPDTVSDKNNKNNDNQNNNVGN